MVHAYPSTLIHTSSNECANLGTIISIHENPFPNHRGCLESKDHAILKLIRRNLLSIFQQLSTASDPSRSNNPIMTVPLRSGLQVVKGSEIVPSDGPSLMFYYLFDDWLTSYSLVARQEHQYGAQLGRLVSILNLASVYANVAIASEDVHKACSTIN